MAIVPILHDGRGRELVLEIKNDQPIAADEVGALLVVLARDYRRLTRRKLVIGRLETGSVIATLVDAAVFITPYASNAVEVSKAINAIVSFSKALRERFANAKNLKKLGATKPEIREPPGTDTVTELAKIVAKSGGEATFKYIGSDGENVQAKITSKEAIEIRERQKTARGALKLAKQQDLLALGLEDGDTTTLARRLAEMGLSTDLDEAIRALVGALRSSGLDSYVEMIASDLAGHGHSHIADLLRQEASRSRRVSLPPITRS